MKTRNLKRLAVGSVLVVVLLRLAPVCDAQITISTQPTFWVRADQGVSPGTPLVASWNNVGSASVAIPSVGNIDSGTEPSLNSNDPSGQSSVQFDLSTTPIPGRFLDASPVNGADLFSGANSTVFIVQKDNVPDNGNSLNWNNNANSGNSYLSMNAANPSQSFPGHNEIVFDSGSGSDFISADITTQVPTFYGNWHVITGVRNGSAGEIHVDGQNLIITGGLGFSGSANFATTGPLSIGGLRVATAADQTIHGSIAEVLVFGSNLSPGDIATVESELGAKYGISIVPEPQAYASAFSVLCLVAGLAMKLRRRIA
jgi:Concanavalin A-like lectin/glucanases superfamily